MTMHGFMKVNFMNIPPAEAKFFHAGRRAGGQIDRTKLIVPFSSLVNKPKMDQ